jgi:UDP-glucose 4-epimerase
MAVSQLIERCISGEPIRLNGDGQQVRDMTFVYDVVEATISAGELDLPAGAVINVSSNHGVSLIRLARTILDLTGANVPIVYGPPAHGDVVRTEGANGLAERLLHWRPFVDTVPGLEAQLEWRLTSRIRS